MLERKVLAIPYARPRPGAAVRFLVAQDAATQEWTFMSGTCEPGERPVPCVLRELHEETRGLLAITKLPQRTKRFRVVWQNKRYDVFFIPMSRWSYDRMHELEMAFWSTRAATDAEAENFKICFRTLSQFKRRKNIWHFISWLMETQSFLNHVPV
jgi:8-oxo-dGTP pyrophosphatase MutT (NUDIX family)